MKIVPSSQKLIFVPADFINPDSLNWGPRYGYIWFPSSIIAGIWVFFFLPEVQGTQTQAPEEDSTTP